jgi:hypothetical protein
LYSIRLRSVPVAFDMGAREHEWRWRTSGDELHFLGSGLLLHG